MIGKGSRHRTGFSGRPSMHPFRRGPYGAASSPAPVERVAMPPVRQTKAACIEVMITRDLRGSNPRGPAASPVVVENLAEQVFAMGLDARLVARAMPALLLLGHGLDARLRCRELRAIRRAVPRHGEAHRAGDAQFRHEALKLVTVILLGLNRSSQHPGGGWCDGGEKTFGTGAAGQANGGTAARDFRSPVPTAAPIGFPTSQFLFVVSVVNPRIPRVLPRWLEGWRTRSPRNSLSAGSKFSEAWG
jgi:hypothetical protein